MIRAILNFFGFGKKEEISQPLTETATLSSAKIQRERPQPSATPPIKKTSVRARNYYRRNGNYFSSSDDSLVEDLMLLVVLDELFNDGDIREVVLDSEITEQAEDLLDIDVSDTPVREETNWKVDVPTYNTPEPATYTPEPEPVRESVSSSYSSGSSDYDSGSSDSSGSDD